MVRGRQRKWVGWGRGCSFSGLPVLVNDDVLRCREDAVGRDAVLLPLGGEAAMMMRPVTKCL